MRDGELKKALRLEKEVPLGEPPFSKGALFFEFFLVGFDACFIALQSLCPILMTASTGIGEDGRFRILFERLEADDGLNNVEIMSMNVAGFSREGGFNHMAGRTAPRPLGFGRIAVFGVFTDGA